MDTGFPDKMEKDYTKYKNPWDFRMPMYDERSSCYVNAGSRYGTGYKQPVGHSGKTKLFSETLPFGKVDTLKTRYIGKENMPIDIVE